MEGDIVKAGQVLLVMEAMKMEHAVKAPLAGRITEINCRAEDQVEADLVLVVVAEE
jgi:biotin carboxyl carrier protein